MDLQRLPTTRHISVLRNYSINLIKQINLRFKWTNFQALDTSLSAVDCAL